MSTTLKKIIKPAYYLFNHLISRIKILMLLRKNPVICLNLGAGNNKGKNGWLTIDVLRDCDIFWDLSKGIPFPNESVSKIYSSHLFEHLTFQEGQKLLDECLRVLVPGGTFSISVPNARIYIEAYLNSESDLNKFNLYEPAFNNTTKIDYLNYMAYMDGHHKYMFDEENLIYLLKLKGMKNVQMRDFDPSLDIEGRRFESIYAEAQK